MPAVTRQLVFPLAAVAVVSVAFLSAGWATFPMDDAWIHAVFARHLAEQGQLTFNLNPPDPGLGTTSILWPLALAAVHPLCGVVSAARLFGLLSYAAVAVLATILAGWMVRGGDRRWAALTGTLVALSGNLAWFSFSGMETTVWLALGLGAVVACQRRRLAVVGLLVGLMLITRIEAVVLLAAVLAAEAVAQRRVTRGMVVMVLLATLVLVPWMGYVHHRTGHWLPTSYSGKRHAQMRGAVQTVNELLGQRDGAPIRVDEHHLPAWTALIYPLGVVGYGFGFVAGAVYLPGPRVPFPGPMGTILGGVSLLGGLVFLVVCPLVWWPALRRTARWARGPDWSDPTHRALAVLACWFILHNLAYWLKLPTPGTASRYQVVNHIAWWLLLGVGASRVGALPWRAVAAVTVAILAVWNAAFWQRVYASDIRHMQQVRLAAADYVRTQLPRNAIVAAHDIGALGWRMDRHCLDLGGLIDPAWLKAAAAGRQAEFLRKQGATHVVLPTKHSSEARPFFDYAAFLGLDRNPRVRLEPVVAFENDYRDWSLGAAPTWNAAPGVTIYRLHLTPSGEPGRREQGDGPVGDTADR